MRCAHDEATADHKRNVGSASFRELMELRTFNWHCHL